jgi:hypothetical protein
VVRWPTGTLPFPQETSTRTRPHGNLAVHSIDRCRVTFTSRRIHPPLLSFLSPQKFNFESETRLRLQEHERACGLDCSSGHCLDDRCFTLGVKTNYTQASRFKYCLCISSFVDRMIGPGDLGDGSKCCDQDINWSFVFFLESESIIFQSICNFIMY